MDASIEEQVVVTDADILVGVPCYKDGPMVNRCLRSLQEPRVQLLIVDNGSALDVKQAIADKGIVIRNAVNRYVNPAWNQMMAFFLNRPDRFDLLVIANSDLVMDSDWASKLRKHRETSKEEQIVFGRVGRPDPSHPEQCSMGAFFAMTQGAVQASYPIPDEILIYGGDDFIFHVNRGVGFSEKVIESLTMSHVVNGTISKSPEIWDVGLRDQTRWYSHVLPELVPQRIREFLTARSESH
jgi:hypothetical protein